MAQVGQGSERRSIWDVGRPPGHAQARRRQVPKLANASRQGPLLLLCCAVTKCLQSISGKQSLHDDFRGVGGVCRVQSGNGCQTKSGQPASPRLLARCELHKLSRLLAEA